VTLSKVKGVHSLINLPPNFPFLRIRQGAPASDFLDVPKTAFTQLAHRVHLTNRDARGDDKLTLRIQGHGQFVPQALAPDVSGAHAS